MKQQKDLLERAWRDYCAVAVKETAVGNDEDSAHLFPEYSEDGRWIRTPADQLSRIIGDDYDHGNWSPGFWFGTRWLAGPVDGRGFDRAAIDARWPHLAARATDHTTHDLGFMFYPSVVLGSALGLLDARRARAGVIAAEQLGRRFNPHGDFLQAFGPVGHHRTAGTSTMDTMMNLPLLWWAGAMPGKENLLVVAKRHARATARAFFRPDGSTYHLVRYAPTAGSIAWRGTFQGAEDTSCWSRGQAWAVAGFAWAGLATGEAEFLETAEWAAEYFIRNLEPDRLPPWDFSAGNEREDVPDASAAAIVALGLLILALSSPEGTQAKGQRTTAYDLLMRCHKHAQNRDGSTEGILSLSCYSLPHGKGVRGATAWGDFYYGLALALATGRVGLEHLDPRPRLGLDGG